MVLTLGTFTRRVFLFALASLASIVRADVRLPAIFGDHMVLQQGATLPVWGTADPGEHVLVSIGERCQETTADSKGNWRVTFRPVFQSSKPLSLIINGNNRMQIDDVLVGDVWICAGEGNMAFPLSDAASGNVTGMEGTDRELRFFQSDERISWHPDHQGSGHWVVCSAETAPGFSGVGYFFARDIRSSHHIPVGMIQCTCQETPVASWISLRSLAQPPSFSTFLADFVRGEDSLKKFKAKDDFSAEYFDRNKKIPSVLFNGMISPLIPYSITGVIWYQGESDDGMNALAYRRMLPRLIRDWRSHWAQGPFPFFFVSLAGFGGDEGSFIDEYSVSDGRIHGGLPWIREGIDATLALPSTGMATATDLGVRSDRYPPDKLDVGRRLAKLARRRVYGEELVDTGPVFQRIKAEENRMRIEFASIGSGLAIGVSPWQPENTLPEITTMLKGFAISGNDRKWFPAVAKIEGDSVLVSSDAVRYPTAVRYNWKCFPDGNLYNKEGLPAPPFRTDTDQPLTHP